MSEHQSNLPDDLYPLKLEFRRGGMWLARLGNAMGVQGAYEHMCYNAIAFKVRRYALPLAIIMAICWFIPGWNIYHDNFIVWLVAGIALTILTTIIVTRSASSPLAEELYDNINRHNKAVDRAEQILKALKATGGNVNPPATFLAHLRELRERADQLEQLVISYAELRDVPLSVYRRLNENFTRQLPSIEHLQEATEERLLVIESQTSAEKAAGEEDLDDQFRALGNGSQTT